ncbi:hypothetical protein W97_08727 [Coniosporium apollinis CBS 100218]|uniref:J domain-containing protein n=1 Tax=Coniosporium apollinis (strain CBS 100218) TaxID=1168221 RepID=R7Z5M5_CONA1|nr:uncharacterized protein W97_08727 [Coniosporium apollinis CBS 100218]EON69467.1 hypothetical protein W97_08727 [Coniosporium apollinis CBS 100218]
MESPYVILGVSPDASPEQIKLAWRKLSLKHHPDKAKAEDREAANKKMQQINEAYDAVKDGGQANKLEEDLREAQERFANLRRQQEEEERRRYRPAPESKYNEYHSRSAGQSYSESTYTSGDHRSTKQDRGRSYRYTPADTYAGYEQKPRYETHAPRHQSDREAGYEQMPHYETHAPRFEADTEAGYEQRPRYETRAPRFEAESEFDRQDSGHGFRSKYETHAPRYEYHAPRYEECRPRYEERRPKHNESHYGQSATAGSGCERKERRPSHAESRPRYEEHGPRYEERKPRNEEHKPRAQERTPQQDSSRSAPKKNKSRFVFVRARPKDSESFKSRSSAQSSQERTWSSRDAYERLKDLHNDVLHHYEDLTDRYTDLSEETKLDLRGGGKMAIACVVARAVLCPYLPKALDVINDDWLKESIRAQKMLETIQMRMSRSEGVGKHLEHAEKALNTAREEVEKMERIIRSLRDIEDQQSRSGESMRGGQRESQLEAMEEIWDKLIGELGPSQDLVKDLPRALERALRRSRR